MTPFQRSLRFVLRYEGAWSDNPADPGGATMRGITLATYAAWRAERGLPAPSKDDLRAITDDEIEAIYRAGYWDAVRGDELPEPVALYTFDMAVNAGPSRSIRLLQEALGVTVDGIIGPQTIAAAHAAETRPLAIEFGAQRIVYYGSLSTFSTFGLGWTRRALAAISAAITLGTPAASLSPSLAGPEPEIPEVEEGEPESESETPVSVPIAIAVGAAVAAGVLVLVLR